MLFNLHEISSYSVGPAPIDLDIFRNEIMSARTFGPLKHVLALAGKAYSLLSGKYAGPEAHLGNVIIQRLGHIRNKHSLRIPDELTKHRVLDIMGDLMLTRTPVIDNITAFRPSHKLNQELRESWKWNTDELS